ncbi:Hcp1 family type VI secretion system effector [Pseudomonas syringae CC1557]|uniref:Hcp1 family type VI secretion system effector n=1 Tax=Pseudomonas syringae CC1557 TaxID=1357279 RepID=W0MQT5_PSESX|nr:type VI secretion system tube protein Hcp [Pseudomonas syringae]AHG39181.1 Hcp1 family type VI secretion system effector [Pseudomonas syringae CC1557]
MAFDTFLWIDGLDGDSSDSEHKNWIEITAYNLAATQAVSRTASSAGGATVGRVYLSHFSIVKRVDIATPKILEACCSGQHFKKIIMSVHRAGGEKQKYLEVVFEEVIISGIHSGNIFDPAASSFPEDVVWFDYAKVNIVYSQQSRTTGLIMGKISAGWDQIRNNTYA